MWLINRTPVSRVSTFRRTGGFGLSKYMPSRAYAKAAAATEKPKPSSAVTEELKKAWKAVAPILDFPKVPSNFLKERPAVPTTIPTKLTVNFVLPRKYEMVAKESVLERGRQSEYEVVVDGKGLLPRWKITYVEFVSNCTEEFLSRGDGYQTQAFACLISTSTSDVQPLCKFLQVDMVIIPATNGLMGVLPGHVPTIAELKPGVLSFHEGTEVKKYIVSGGFAFVHANSVTDIVTVEAVLAENLDIEEAKKNLADYSTKFNSATTDLEKAEAQIAIEVYSSLVAALS